MDVRPTVLVVEDEPAIRDLVALFLTEEGFAVVLASNGGDALRALAEGLRPRMMLLDMRMPVCDGAEVLRALRSQPEQERPPVVVMSGSAELAPQVGLSAVHRVLIKPFGLDELLRCVHSAITESPVASVV